MERTESIGKKFEQLIEIIALLRSDRGCPWDREQDEESILHYFLEEVYEVVEAVDKGDVQALAEELGDVFFALANLSRHLGLNPELVLRQANKKFRVRFSALVTELKRKKKKLGQASPGEMEVIWQKLKKEHRSA